MELFFTYRLHKIPVCAELTIYYLKYNTFQIFIYDETQNIMFLS